MHSLDLKFCHISCLKLLGPVKINKDQDLRRILARSWQVSCLDSCEILASEIFFPGRNLGGIPARFSPGSGIHAKIHYLRMRTAKRYGKISVYCYLILKQLTLLAYV